MKLVKFTVTNYRSITRAYRLTIDDLTVLIGPNNEGKSNILRALHTGLGLLVDIPMRISLGKLTPTGDFRVPLGLAGDQRYKWARDYPIALQHSKPDGCSVFGFEFLLEDTEIAAFRDAVGSNLNGTLPVQISLGQRDLELRVRKRGPGGKALTRKAAHIANFLAAHLDYEYIPAVRTAQASEEIVEQMVRRAFEPLEADPKYREALAAVAAIQQPLLEQLSKTVFEMLKPFLTSINGVRVEVTERERATALRRAVQIVVDDGTPTPLKQKGDGVQSLAALGLIRESSRAVAGSRNLVLAIEEPESHLHPLAIHELRRVLGEMAVTQQVVVTTHCPLLINRTKIASNIIVQGGMAKPAESISALRDVLGVRASDNLLNAAFVLVVEGKNDLRSLQALLSAKSPVLRRAIADQALVLDTLAGGTNLSYKLGTLRDILCGYHVWLDADATGRAAADAAKREGILKEVEVHLATVVGKTESEMEDLYREDLYEKMLQDEFGVSTRHRDFAGTRKWSDRLALVFARMGKDWTPDAEEKVKRRVSELAASTPGDAIEGGRAGPFNAMCAEVERRLVAAMA